MNRKINCFVSFSVLDADEASVRFLLDYLSKQCQERVNFKAYFNERSGTDLDRFMRADLGAADAIMALFTPDYKNKADNHIHSGILIEYMHIVELLEGKSSEKPPLFIPVLWRGGAPEELLPNYFNGRELTRDRRALKPFQGKGSVYLPDRLESSLKPTVLALVTELLDKWKDTDPRLNKIQARVDKFLLEPSALIDVPEGAEPVDQIGGVELPDIFFRKSERGPFDISQFSKFFFVKTNAFRAIGNYHKIAFTGRKGSGKTTLLKVYKHQNESRYFAPIDVEVNDWNLHYLLQDLTFRSAEGDLTYTAEESRVFDFIWPVFLSLCMVRSIVETRVDVSISTLLPIAEHQENFLRNRDRYESLFEMSIGVVRDFINECISEASNKSESAFKADLLRLINVQSCTEFLLGKQYNGLRSFVQSDERQRSFLFCLDRFDTEIQKYRKDLKERALADVERIRREQREVFWIQGLVELIDHLRSPDFASPNHDFYKLIGPLVDFCVPLPRDRLYEVQLRRRDAIVGEISEEINWQPYELLTMLRRRLEIVWGIPPGDVAKKGTRARGRYEQVLAKSGRSIPNQVDIRINGAIFQVDLFLNVLRHSFFRPRDVLLHFSKIIARVELARERNESVSPAYVARIISEQTHRIVEEEFLGEFADTFSNLREVLNYFRASPQILTRDDLYARVASVRFGMYGQDDIVDFGRKVRLLYEIGFLGVCSSGVQLGGVSFDDYDFYFFNPRFASNLERAEVLESLSFAIHPVFIEHLSLKMNSKGPVMMLTWEKIEERDVFD